MFLFDPKLDEIYVGNITKTYVSSNVCFWFDPTLRGIGTAHFGFEGRNKEHKDPRLSISTLTGPWVK